MRNRFFPFLTALVVAMTLSGCAQKMVNTVAFGDPHTAIRILIATEQSEFKQAVTEKVVNGFENQALFFKITDLRNLESEAVASYTVIVIINTCVAWDLDPRVKTFFESTVTKEHIILLTTAGDADWQAEAAGVDAFTSASSPADTERAAENLRTRIRAIIDAAS